MEDPVMKVAAVIPMSEEVRSMLPLADVGLPAELQSEEQQERAEWLKWRRHGIGGSDIAALCGLSRYGSPWSVWAEKVGLRPDSASTERQQIGKDLEPALDRMFNRRTGLHLTGAQTMCWDTEHPHRRCTVDGFAYETEGILTEHVDIRFGGALGTVQHKTDYRRDWKKDGIPPDIRAQCIWELGVTRLPLAYLSVLHGGFTYEVYQVPFDEDDWLFMCDVADRFWADHVLTGTAPDIDGSDATRYALRDVYPEEDPGTRAPVSGDDLELHGNLKAEVKRAKDELQQVENRLKAAIGDAEIGTVGGQPALTLRAQTRTVTCKECGHTEVSEPFRVLRPAPAKLKALPPVDVLEVTAGADIPALTTTTEGDTDA